MRNVNQFQICCCLPKGLFLRSLVLSALMTLSLILQGSTEHGGQETKKIAIVGCTVITMSEAGILENHTVLIDDGSIKSVNKMTSNEVPASYEQIDGKGKFLIPGLCDMHVHLSGEVNLISNLIYGVTSVLQMSGQRGEISDFISLRTRIDNREIVGPRLYLTGPMFDGLGYQRQTTAYSMTKEDVPDVLKEHLAKGYDFVKVHNFTPIEVYRYLVENSTIPIIGHIPFAISHEEVLESQAMIAHSGNFFSKLFYNQKCPDHYWECMSRVTLDIGIQNKLVEQITKSGVYVTANLTYLAIEKSNDQNWNAVLEDPEFQYLDQSLQNRWKRDNPIARGEERRSVVRKALEIQARFDYELIKKLNDHVVSILAGTDMGVEGIFPGRSLHLELSELVKAGLTPLEALQTATINPGLFFEEFLDQGIKIGRIQKGFAADLVLLDANPLEDIANTLSINGVVSMGLWYTFSQLEDMRKAN